MKRTRGRPRDPLLDDRILTAARELVDEVGYHHVSVDGIAARAGVGKATVYRRWSTKAAVITDAMVEELNPPPAPDTGSVVDDALIYLREIVHVLTLLGGPSVVAEALAERGEAGQVEIREILRARAPAGVALLDRGKARGQIPGSVPGATVVDAWAGCLLYRIVFVRSVPDDGELRDMVTMILAR